MADIALSSSSSDTLSFSNDGTEVAYKPNQTGPATLAMAFEGADNSQEVSIGGPPVGAAQTVSAKN